MKENYASFSKLDLDSEFWVSESVTPVKLFWYHPSELVMIDSEMPVRVSSGFPENYFSQWDTESPINRFKWVESYTSTPPSRPRTEIFHGSNHLGRNMAATWCSSSGLGSDLGRVTWPRPGTSCYWRTLKAAPVPSPSFSPKHDLANSRSISRINSESMSKMKIWRSFSRERRVWDEEDVSGMEVYGNWNSPFVAVFVVKVEASV